MGLLMGLLRATDGATDGAGGLLRELLMKSY
jgi:hypothetical protein